MLHHGRMAEDRIEEGRLREVCRTVDLREAEAQVDRMGLRRAEGSVDHLAFVAGDHDAIVARLDAAGVHAVSNEMPAAGLRQLFLDDPNGVRIELNVR